MKVLVGHGRVVHLAHGPHWPGLTECGRSWTDEAPDEAPVTCAQCHPTACPATRVAPGAAGADVTHHCTKAAGHRGKHDGGFGSWRWSD